MNTLHFHNGTIVLDGETIAVDCLSVRDRSWGPRPRGPGKGKAGVGYSFATASGDDAFLAYTIPMVGSDDVSTGYLIRDGEYAHLVGGRRVGSNGLVPSDCAASR